MWGEGKKTHLLLLLAQFVPSLVYLDLHSVLFNDLAGAQGLLEVLFDERTGILRVQKGSGKGLLGGVWIPRLLLALLSLLGGDGAGGVVGGLDDLAYAVGGDGSGVHGSTGGCRNRRGDLKPVKIAVFAGEDRRRVLHVGAQEVVEAILDVGEAALEVAEGHDDLAM